MNASGQRLDEIQVDRDNLYKEEMFTDLKIATLRRLTPIKADGSPDESRQTLFVGQTQLMSQVGVLPVQCEIEADTLEEAIREFPAAVQKAVDEMIQEAQEVRRQEASRIVVPGQGGAGAGGLGNLQQSRGSGLDLGRFRQE